MAQNLIIIEGGVEPSRRDFVSLTAAALGAVGIGAAAWPFIDSLNPAADQRVPDYIDLTSFAEGERRIVLVPRGLLFVSHRTAAEIAAAKAGDSADLKDPERDSERVRRDDWLVVTGYCTFNSCPLGGQGKNAFYWQYWSGLSEEGKLDRGDFDGWVCHCCGSQYDTSGRIRRGPAPKNLIVPDYRLTAENMIEISWQRP